MPPVRAAVDELVQRRLVDERRPLPRDFDGLLKRRSEPFGHDDVADTNRWEERLAERAEVDHAATLVQPLQRRQRAAVIPELAVVIVLEDPGLARGGPPKQFKPARERHGHAERILV